MTGEGFTIKEIVGIRVDDCYMSLRALSVYSGISKRKLDDLRKDPYNPLPTFRVDGKVLVKKSEFDRWMERYRVRVSGASRNVDQILEEVMYDFRR